MGFPSRRRANFGGHPVFGAAFRFFFNGGALSVPRPRKKKETPCGSVSFFLTGARGPGEVLKWFQGVSGALWGPTLVFQGPSGSLSWVFTSLVFLTKTKTSTIEGQMRLMSCIFGDTRRLKSADWPRRDARSVIIRGTFFKIPNHPN